MSSKSKNKKMMIHGVQTTFAVFIACLLLFPIYWALLCSFKFDAEIFAMPPSFFPKEFTLESYLAQFEIIKRPFINSATIAISSMCISLTLAFTAAYGLARYKNKTTGAILLLFLVTQMLPASLVLTPLYLTFSKLKLLNTYLAPIMATATISIPFIPLLMRPIYAGIPKDLEEAARIDGCTTMGAFIRIILPVSKQGIVTASCFGFCQSWNDLAYSMTFNTKEVLRPLTSGIYRFMSLYGMQWNRILAYGIIVILPPTILFLTMQKYIIEGLVGGAVKG